MPVPIPSAWKNAVCRILRSGDASGIRITTTARNDWALLFPDHWYQDLYEALADALSATTIEGVRRDMDEDGETYEFFFSHEGITLYGKVNLLRSGKVVIVYSAHKPRYGDKL